MLSLPELEERRVRECRLLSELALESLEDAHAFLRDRGLLTRTPDSALPSLFGACHEEPYRPGAGGFGEWPRTKWPWSFELAEQPGVVAPKIHRGKTLYLSEEVARLADPIVRAELRRLEQDDEPCARLLRRLREAGPSLVEDLQVELGLSSRELRSLRAPLERSGAVVARLRRFSQAGRETWETELARWDALVTGPAAAPDLGALVVAGVRAAVLCPEREPRRWFSWSGRWEDDLLQRLVSDGRLFRPEPGWLAYAH